MIYKVEIEPRTILDMQDAIDYYNSKQHGLGRFFYPVVEEHIITLTKSQIFQIRYKDYYGFPNRKFPFILLNYIGETLKIIYIMSVFNTHLNPVKYPK
jgi:hypothetical protein